MASSQLETLVEFSISNLKHSLKSPLHGPCNMHMGSGDSRTDSDLVNRYLP
jgi:hypothetical protein